MAPSRIAHETCSRNMLCCIATASESPEQVILRCDHERRSRDLLYFISWHGRSDCSVVLEPLRALADRLDISHDLKSSLLFVWRGLFEIRGRCGQDCFH